MRAGGEFITKFVVIGMGYVGIPCAALLADVPGFQVTGVQHRSERSGWKIDHLNAGLCPFEDDEPFLIVTSASHMPRSIALLGAQGLNPIAAPADFASDATTTVSWEAPSVHRLYPNASSLWRSERTVYEYLGLLWARLTGMLSSR